MRGSQQSPDASGSAGLAASFQPVPSRVDQHVAIGMATEALGLHCFRSHSNSNMLIQLQQPGSGLTVSRS